jgi:hypothetical protein
MTYKRLVYLLAMLGGAFVALLLDLRDTHSMSFGDALGHSAYDMAGGALAALIWFYTWEMGQLGRRSTDPS